MRVDDVGQTVDAVGLVLHLDAETLSVERVFSQGEGLVEAALHPHDLVKRAVGFLLGFWKKEGELPSPVLHHVDELDGFGRVDLTLPTEPDIGVDVVGAVGDIQLVDGDGIKTDLHQLGGGRWGALGVEGAFLDGGGGRLPAHEQKPRDPNN